MFSRLLARASAVLLLALSALTHAQESPEPLVALPANASSDDTFEGKVTYYGRKHAGRKTANGERFNPNALTMAHRTLPFGTLVRVTNLRNNQSVVVRVNDRGPRSPHRVADLTTAAASKISMLRAGVAHAMLETLGAARPDRAATP